MKGDTSDKIREYIKDVDKDGDGRISYEEVRRSVPRAR